MVARDPTKLLIKTMSGNAENSLSENILKVSFQIWERLFCLDYVTGPLPEWADLQRFNVPSCYLDETIEKTYFFYILRESARFLI